MKKIAQIFIFLNMLLLFVACSDETDQTTNTGELSIKMVQPVNVVTGQKVYITGSNFTEVKEIIFPDNISVTNFERVGFNQLSAITPPGIKDGNIILKSDDGQTYIAPNEIYAVSAKFKMIFPKEIKTGEILTIQGENLLEIKQIIFPDNIIVDALFFNRKSNTEIKVAVPKGTVDGSGMVKMASLSGAEMNTSNIMIEVSDDGPIEDSKVDPITPNTIILLDFEPHGGHDGNWDNSWGGNSEIVTDSETGNTFLKVTGDINGDWVLNCNHQANIGDGATWPWTISNAEDYMVKLDVLIPSDVDGEAVTGIQFVFSDQWHWYGDNLLPKTTDGEWVTVKVPLTDLGMTGAFDFSTSTNGLFGNIPKGVCFDNLRIDPIE